MEACNRSLQWKPAMEACSGSLLWKPAVEACNGSLQWKPALEACYGSLQWKPAVEASPATTWRWVSSMGKTQGPMRKHFTQVLLLALATSTAWGLSRLEKGSSWGSLASTVSLPYPKAECINLYPCITLIQFVVCSPLCCALVLCKLACAMVWRDRRHQGSVCALPGNTSRRLCSHIVAHLLPHCSWLHRRPLLLLQPTQPFSRRYSIQDIQEGEAMQKIREIDVSMAHTELLAYQFQVI